MSSLAAAARRSRWNFRGWALVLMLFSAAIAMSAQCPTIDEKDPFYIPKVPVAKPEDEEPMLPEAGLLTDTRYTSQYFGFAFDLPMTVEGHRYMMPVMPEKEHALLALQFEKDTRRGYIMVSAIDPRPGFEVNTPEQQEAELKHWARFGTGFGGPPPFVVPDYMLRAGRFYYSVRHNGPDYAAQYWTRINNYAIKVVIGTNDQQFLRKAKNAMAQAHFYCPQDDGTFTTKEGRPVRFEGEPYFGPTVPTFLVNQAIRDKPAKKIPLGEVQDGTYHNPDLGLQYELPKGWAALPPKVDADPPEDPVALREYKFVRACSQTLLRIAPQAAAGAAGPAPGSMIVLRALDPNCLSMRTATSVGDKLIADEVAASLEQMAEFGQIDTDQVVSLANHVFMVFHGTVEAEQRNQDLAKRRSQSIFVTRHDKMLFMWTVIAPTSKTLEEIPVSGIVFDGSRPIELTTALRAKN